MVSLSRLAFGLLLTTFVASSGLAQSYSVTPSSGSFQSVASSGTIVSMNNADDGYGTITVPFDLRVFGRVITEGSYVYPTTNGFVALDTYDASYENQPIPSSASPNGFVAPFWDDLILGNGQVISATLGSFGARRFVIEWSGVSIYGTTSVVSFQVQFTEGSEVIELAYSGSASGESASIGIEDSTGGQGGALSCTPACRFFDVPTGTRLLLEPGGSSPGVNLYGSFGSTIPSVVRPGDFVSVELEVFNSGDTSSGPFDVHIVGSTDRTFNSSDLPLAAQSVSSIAPGGVEYPYFEVTVPSGLPLSPGSTMYVAALIDPQQIILETSESDNVIELGATTYDPGSNPGEVTILSESLPSGRVGSSYQFELRSNPIATWQISSGSIPGVFLSSSGTLSGVPTQSGSFGIRIEASAPDYVPASRDFVVQIAAEGGLAITTTSLPAGAIGVPYSASIEAEGGDGSYAFQIVGGAPDWLRMTNAGVLSGTPDASGEYSVSFAVTDGTFQQAASTLSLVVRGSNELAILTSSLPAAAVGVTYSAALVAEGGHPPYSFRVASGNLPTGLMLDSSGTISGQPTAPGTSNVRFEVSDAESATATAELPIQVVAGGELRITVPTQITVQLNVEANVRLTAEGGRPPYSWSMQGFLPPGLSLSSEAAAIVGVPTSSVAATVKLTVQDSDSGLATMDVEVKVTARARPTASNQRKSGSGCGCESSGPSSVPLPMVLLLLAFLFRARRGTHGA